MTSRLLALLFLSGLGCSSVDVDDIERHQQSWREAGIHDYAFVSHLVCFCTPTDRDGIRTEVRNDIAVAALGVSTGLPFPDQAQTIDDIFEQALDSARSDPYEFEIAYNSTHGFVRTLQVDDARNTADDEFSIDVTCFSKDVDDGCPVVALSEAACAAAGGTPRKVAEPDPWQTCDSTDQDPLGRISDSDLICCPGGH
jgi:hypothetical protein